MRTTFRRQVTLIVSLLLAATILLGVSFWGLFTHYVIRERESSLRGTAQSVVWLTQTSAVSDDVTTSWDFLRSDGRNGTGAFRGKKYHCVCRGKD